MATPESSLIGRGLYAPTEASLLTRVPIRRIRRWTRGYWYVHRGIPHWSEPVIKNTLGEIGGAPVLDFADLMEVRFLSRFRDCKIGWRTIRLAAERAKQVLGTSHPFSSNRFSTDGRNILLEIQDETGDTHLLDLVRDQWEFQRIVVEFLRAGLHYEGKDSPQWWSPLGPGRTVAVDPARSFGAPIVVPGSVRTRILHGGYLAERSFDAVADWYNVTRTAVEDAVEFEEGLQRAA